MEIKPQCLNSAQDITASYLPVREHSISLPPSAKVGTDRAPGNPGVGSQVSSHPRYQTKGSRNLNAHFLVSQSQFAEAQRRTPARQGYSSRESKARLHLSRPAGGRPSCQLSPTSVPAPPGAFTPHNLCALS